MSGRKRLREQKKIKLLETEIDSLQKTLKLTFDGTFQRWYNDDKMNAKHPDVTKMLLFAALIPPSTAEVERTFSLMKLICTRLTYMNYKPISMLPTLSKVYEKLFYSQIYNYFNITFSKYLCGFREGQRTQHCLLLMLESLKKCYRWRTLHWYFINRLIEGIWWHISWFTNCKITCLWSFENLS